MRYITYLIIEVLSSIVSIKNIKVSLADRHGGLILSRDGVPIEDKDWIKYKSLKKDKCLSPINLDDLPSDFCENACNLIDEFRRKTVDLKEEWMIYFNYLNGEIIYCWQGNVGKSGGDFNIEYFEGRHIASVHSHPRGYYSFPSPDNFDILENDFEDYEIITSVNAFWIVEFKGSVGYTVRKNFQTNLWIEFNKIEKDIKLMYNKFNIAHNIENAVSSYLLNHVDKNIENIELKWLKRGLIKMGIKKKSNIGHAYKCSGIPMYPKEHSIYEKHLTDVPEGYIKSREKRVEKFLKNFFQDFSDDKK